MSFLFFFFGARILAIFLINKSLVKTRVWPNFHIHIYLRITSDSCCVGGGRWENVAADDGVGGEVRAPPRHTTQSGNSSSGFLRENSLISHQHNLRSQRRHSPPSRSFQTQRHPPHHRQQSHVHVSSLSSFSLLFWYCLVFVMMIGNGVVVVAVWMIQQCGDLRVFLSLILS